ncbi:Hypothetical protein SMAX5B_005811 [Scophthalmus maximus]|uniref:Uncharacterized protein n=1 Tax=Scophthalmus maximus TaxID=52904 RepID=A0A2U9BKJ6_SCOMX|nr:Hypothetical protein SMAX5B_005811 [Scophthalmus maximus]
MSKNSQAKRIIKGNNAGTLATEYKEELARGQRSTQEGEMTAPGETLQDGEDHRSGRHTGTGSGNGEREERRGGHVFPVYCGAPRLWRSAAGPS